MEDTKKLDEAAKPEELTERTPLTDEELDQASGGVYGRSVIVVERFLDQTTLDAKVLDGDRLTGHR